MRQTSRVGRRWGTFGALGAIVLVLILAGTGLSGRSVVDGGSAIHSLDTLPAGRSGTSATWVSLSANNTPPPLAGFAAVYDPAIRGVLLFGGCLTGNLWNASCEPDGQTWTYVNGTWTELRLTTSPTARLLPQMAYDPTLGTVVLFGGSSGTDGYYLYNDTWEFSGTTWTRVPTPTAPYGGMWSQMAWDPAVSAIVLLDAGQNYDSGTALNTTWEFSAQKWVEVPTTSAPPPRGDPAMFWDNASAQFLTFGGFQCWDVDLCFNHDDTWSFEPSGAWVNITPDAPEPIARNQIAAAYDPGLGGPVIFGGHAGAAYYNSTWVFENGSWVNITAGDAPSIRAGASMVYDAATHQLLLFGGYYEVWASTYTYYNNLWVFEDLPALNTSTPLTAGLDVGLLLAGVGVGAAAVGVGAGGLIAWRTALRRAGEDILQEIRFAPGGRR
jgi:hypothetical protein